MVEEWIAKQVDAPIDQFSLKLTDRDKSPPDWFGA